MRIANLLILYLRIHTPELAATKAVNFTELTCLFFQQQNPQKHYRSCLQQNKKLLHSWSVEKNSGPDTPEAGLTWKDLQTIIVKLTRGENWKQITLEGLGFCLHWVSRAHTHWALRHSALPQAPRAQHSTSRAPGLQAEGGKTHANNTGSTHAHDRSTSHISISALTPDRILPSSPT